MVINLHLKLNKMKAKYINVLMCLLLVFGCKEEPIGQYAVDADAPAEISDVSVENFKGYSEISYKIPSDKDLLYVSAVYTNEQGVEIEARASAYTNKLVVSGFAKAGDFQIQLYTVDKSENRSNPVSVTISPLDSPIFDIYASVNIVESFGGIKLTWENPQKEDIVVEVIGSNEDGEYDALQNFYGSAENGFGAVRGLDAEERQFGVVVRDSYKNRTDTLFATLTPLFEQELDKELHKTMNFSKKFTQSNYGGPQYKVWDGESYVAGSGCFDLYGNGEDPIYWNYDLGVTAKISRFKMWSRNTHYYQLAHPRHIQIWGTTDEEAAKDTESFDGWELLFEVKTEKVSGNDEYGDITPEDIAHAKAGEEFEFDLSASPTRFVRIRTLETWGKIDRSWIAELTWWGEVIETH
ncbi:DUF4959 domain-containing protein [Puteibacter caeruleilacunae]|nr:DUF4959 domain-containing protein [Puteibacter caeruleilacunae]